MDDDFVTALESAITRIMAMERRAVADAVNAVGYGLYYQETYPYWTNHPELFVPVSGSPRDAGEFEQTVTMRLFIDHIQAGYEGERRFKAWGYAARTVLYFRRYHLLVDTVDTTGIRWLSPRGCTIIPARGLFISQNQPQEQLFLEFSLTVPFNYDAGD